MSDFRWWHLLLNPQFVIFVVVMIGVIYCLWKGYGISSKKFEFQGLKAPYFEDVESDWPVKRRKVSRKRKFNKYEERCRQIFEEIFRKKFKSVRPDWLRNPVTGKNLELDGFCPDIKTHIGKGLAFEYDGEQHSKYKKHFHGGNHDNFVYQVKRDEWKDLKCKEKGVLLIRIPHFVIYQDLDRYISEKLLKNGLKSTKQSSSEGFLAGLYD